MEVDHKDGVGLNNAEANMQTMTKAEHHRVTRQRRSADWRTGLTKAWEKNHSKTQTGHYGVSPHRKGFMAQAKVAGKFKYLGKFDDVLSAAIAVNRYLRQFDPADQRLNKDANGVVL